MSANNQILIKKHKGRWYVFNVMAESWSKTNQLKASNGVSFNEHEDAVNYAYKLDEKYFQEGMPIEYGIKFNRLAKDGANVTIK